MKRDYRPLIQARLGSIQACAEEMGISRQWLWQALLERPTQKFLQRLADALGYDSVEGMQVAVDQLAEFRRPK